MGENGSYFVEWKEQFVSKERGNRVVHYFLKDVSGEFILAVVGTERSVRHMFYVVAEEFLNAIGEEGSASAGYRWRSRREVVNWLTSMLSPQHRSKSPRNDPTYRIGCPQTEYKGHLTKNLRGHTSDIVWSGVAWTCGKQLKHYPSFRRNGIEIAVQSFVFVMSEEENHHLAYLEDMYEDRKGQRKVKVRWFHRNQEVKGAVSLRNAHPKEVFITPYAQVISAECVDGPAIVLTRQHYEKFLEIIPSDLLTRVYFCHRQFKSNRLKAFKLSKFRGYFGQSIFACVGPDFFEDEEFSPGENVKVGAKRPRNCLDEKMLTREIIPHKVKYQTFNRKVIYRHRVDKRPINVNDKVELLCQDSGLRGCWFRCTVSEVLKKQIKVQYDDVKDEEGCGNLEEWVPSLEVAMRDKLGMRCVTRPTIRPAIDDRKTDYNFEVGTPVDAWWSDGWWEGVVAGISNTEDGSFQICIPSENLFLNINQKDLRVSRDWTGDKWVDIVSDPEISSKISTSISPESKNSASSDPAKEVEANDVPQSREEPLTAIKLDMVEEEKREPGNLVSSDDLEEKLEPANLGPSNDSLKEKNASEENKASVEASEYIEAPIITISPGKESEDCVPHNSNNDLEKSGTGAEKCEPELLEVVA